LVLPDADLELAVRGTVFSSMMHAGQACVATTRMLVPDSRYDEALELLEARGAPAHASFDHDLGDGQASGADIAQAMVSADQISRHGPGGLADLQAQGFTFRFPEGFTYTVHSMNSVGGPGINQILGRYLAYLREG